MFLSAEFDSTVLSRCVPKRSGASVAGNAAVVAGGETYKKALKKSRLAEETSTLETSEFSAPEAETPEDVFTTYDDAPSHRLALPSPPSGLTGTSSSEQASSTSSGQSLTRVDGALEAPSGSIEELPAGAGMTLGASNCPEQSPIVKLVLELRLQNGEILRQLGAMQQDIRNLSFNLSQMKASMSAAPPSPEMAPEPSRAPLPKLPAATMEEFRELENALKDKATATALQLEVATWVRATDTVAEACRSLLERALKKEVQIKFSLLGRKGKLPFRGTLLCHIVTGCGPTAAILNKALVQPIDGDTHPWGGRNIGSQWDGSSTITFPSWPCSRRCQLCSAGSSSVAQQTDVCENVRLGINCSLI
ncbi:uncharacterized protein ISCGN_025348 [Ixodes scapularis]